MVVGPRRGHPAQIAPPHNVPFIVLGAGLLWFGWLGFNGGSGLVAGHLASLACLTTNSAGAAAALVWMLVETQQRGKPTAVGVATGAVAGLVAITPAAGFVSPMAALAIGAIAALVCSQALQIKGRFRLDDSLDVLPVHGLAGLLGVLLTGVLAGGAGQLWIQLQAAVFTALWVAVGTYAVLRLVALVEPLRVRPDEERQGLDVNAHGEEAYNNEFTG
jgi:Amt family ammonium transporter